MSTFLLELLHSHTNLLTKLMDIFTQSLKIYSYQKHIAIINTKYTFLGKSCTNGTFQYHRYLFNLKSIMLRSQHIVLGGSCIFLFYHSPLYLKQFTATLSSLKLHRKATYCFSFSCFSAPSSYMFPTLSCPTLNPEFVIKVAKTSS